jgi:hypothetical protein
MERNPTRNALSENIDIVDLKYDIQVLITELNLHQSKTKLFVDAIKAQKNDLNKILESQKSRLPIKGVYQ